MPKYMKDAKFKKPRNKYYEEKEPNSNKKSKHKHVDKSKHKHEYETCIIREHFKGYIFLTIGKRCKLCNRVAKDGEILFTTEIPERYSSLPVVEIGDNNNEKI